MGDDVIFGGERNDALRRGDGADRLYGEPGGKILSGGDRRPASWRDDRAADLLFASRSSGVDVADHFDVGTDVRHLVDAGFSSKAALSVARTDYGSYSVIMIDASAAG